MSFKAATKHVLTGFVLGSGLCASHYVVEIRKQENSQLSPKVEARKGST
jgi:hypothetical protein